MIAAPEPTRRPEPRTDRWTAQQRHTAAVNAARSACASTTATRQRPVTPSKRSAWPPPARRRHEHRTEDPGLPLREPRPRRLQPPGPRLRHRGKCVVTATGQATGTPTVPTMWRQLAGLIERHDLPAPFVFRHVEGSHVELQFRTDGELHEWAASYGQPVTTRHYTPTALHTATVVDRGLTDLTIHLIAVQHTQAGES